MPIEVASPVQHWLGERTLSSIYPAQYCNYLAAERTKEWWIADGDEPNVRNS